MLGHPAFELDWNLVRTFVAVVQAGSLAAGARQLGIAHPTAARHVQQLESDLGMSLFNRTAKGLVLSEAGRRLNNNAREMHESALAFQAASDAVRQQPLERVRISVADILADLLPSMMLSELSAPIQAPVTIDLLVGNDNVNLMERDADIALRHVRPEQQELLCRRIGVLEMGVYAHQDYVAEYGMLSADNISGHRFVDGNNRDYLFRGAHERGIAIAAEQIVLRSDSKSALRAAVQAGWGIGAFPKWMAKAQSQWQSVYDAKESIGIDVWIVARPEVRNSAALSGLFSRLGDSLAQRITQTL